MTSKKYVVFFVSVLYMFMTANLVLWHGTVKTIFQQRDLNRMGSIKTTEPLTEDKHYPKHHTELADYIASGNFESFDVLTIGDSFTNGKDGGSYPDYLVNEYGLKVLNAKINISDLYILDKFGWLDKISPKAVIFEMVERGVQGFLWPKSLEIKMTDEKAKAILSRSAETPEPNTDDFLPAISFRSTMIYIYNKIYHLLNPEQLSPEAYITKLDRNFFTNPGFEDTLLYYAGDLGHLGNTLNSETVNQNLNAAARLLKGKGIKLIFFSAADKYDLYYPYITDKKGRFQNPFFQKMRDVPGKEYIFVDTMTPLRQALELGEQDLYWLNDTHWSHKGIKIVCDEIVKYILPDLR